MTIIVIGALWHTFDASNATAARLGLIMAIEVISFIFHVWVVLGWRRTDSWPVLATYFHKFKTRAANDSSDHWNWYKWVEYALTATMGTISVGLKAQSTVEHSKLVGFTILIALGGIAQQYSGYVIDNPDNFPNWTANRFSIWVLGAAWQTAEFVLVTASWGLKVSASSALFVVYACMWSVFGVIAFFRVLNLEAKATTGVAAYFTLDNTETLYSAFGWMAKLAVAATTLADINGVESDTMTVGLVFAVGVPMLVGAAMWAKSTCGTSDLTVSAGALL